MTEEPIGEKELFTVNYYDYGEPYYGSRGKMNFRIAREPMANVHFKAPDERGEAKFRVTVWPGPYAYAVTDEKQKKTQEFEYTGEGLSAAIRWLNEQASSMNEEE